MKARRSFFLCALAALTTAGLVRVHYWAQAHGGDRSSLSAAAPFGAPSPVGPWLEADGPLSQGWNLATGPGPAFGLVPPPQPPEPAISEPSLPAGPRALPLPERAEPLTADSGQDSAILKIITDELPGASPEDRRAWLEQLRGLPPGAVREMLQLRRGLGSPLGRPETRLPPLPVDIDELPWNAEPIDQPVAPRSPVDVIESALPALTCARAVVLNNLANAETDGFKRAQVAYRDLPYDYVTSDATENETAREHIAIGRGVRLAGTSLDVSRGPLRPSPNPLHVAIDGEGFFQGTDGRRVLYTRLGRLSIGPEGALCVAAGPALLPLEPRLQVPSDAASIRIAENGVVTACGGEDDEWSTVGRLQLVRFADPGALSPQGDCLFAATPPAGTPLISFPGEGNYGLVKQFAVEASNVDVEAEIAALERIQQRIEQLSRFAVHALSFEFHDRLAHRRKSPREPVRPAAADEAGHASSDLKQWLDTVGSILRRHLSASRESR